MSACCECGAILLMRSLSTYSSPGLLPRGMVDASSVMISAIRSERPSSDPPNVGKGEFSAAEVQAASQETEDRERDMENRRTVGEGRSTCLAHCRAIHMVCSRVVAVKSKVKAETKVNVDVKAKMLERRS